MTLKKTLKEIAELLGGTVKGDGDLAVTGLSGIDDAGPGQLSFVADKKFAARAKKSRASALVVPGDLKLEGFDLICVDDVTAAWEKVLDLIRPAPIRFDVGVHPSAVVSGEAKLGSEVIVMAHAVVEPGAEIGDRTVIYPGVYVGHDVSIGRDCRLYPNVVLRERVILKDRVILHAGTVIGADGFGYAEDGKRRLKQEQFGTVILEEDVEVGANVAVDRARFDVTRIGRGTKIDNLVQIAHNVVIGENSIIISQTGIAGSARIGKNVILAGQVGVAGHIKIGDNVTVAAKGGVTKSTASNQVLYGNPAGDIRQRRREVASLRKLPGLIEKVRELSERLRRLEAQSENDQESR
jgi:UDP-3-O-[3-hydroxymyristoyl] glucosamine N-acyltransferase